MRSGRSDVVIDRVTTSEEKILCSGTSGTTVTVSSGGRGADGTSASSHLANATVSVCVSAVDGDEANQAVVGLLGQSGATPGDIPYVTGTSPTTYGRAPIGAAGTVLTSTGSVPNWVAQATLLDTAAADIAPIATTHAAGSVGKPADAGHIHGSTITTEGDLIVGGRVRSTQRLPVGSTGAMLYVQARTRPGSRPGTAGSLLEGGAPPSWIAAGSAGSLLEISGSAPRLACTRAANSLFVIQSGVPTWLRRELRGRY